ncbi:MAG: GNAT family N-acetyltransferase [Deltaproteobacteria bacterium]|nr:GNAT family N-acetyltransferase [Deltaproteobacteria bacterium]
MTDKDVADPQSPKIKPLGKKHDRVVFSCGNDALDTYLKKRASQDTKKKIATTFVMADSQSSAVIGYYTLSATSILLADLPDQTARKLPKYPHLSATLLGRLAIDRRHQGSGYGELLIIDALRRALQATTEVASYAVVVDSINERARSFYEHYEFCAFPDRKLRLFLPMKTIADLFS